MRNGGAFTFDQCESVFDLVVKNGTDKGKTVAQKGVCVWHALMLQWVLARDRKCVYVYERERKNVYV